MILTKEWCSLAPTKAQKLNAKRFNYDVNDTLGLAPYWSFNRCHVLTPASVPHDELFIYDLTPEEKKIVNHAFYRDLSILTAYFGTKSVEFEACIFTGIVISVTPFMNESLLRVEGQAALDGLVAMRYAFKRINSCAVTSRITPPYADLLPPIRPSYFYELAKELGDEYESRKARLRNCGNGKKHVAKRNTGNRRRRT